MYCQETCLVDNFKFKLPGVLNFLQETRTGHAIIADRSHPSLFDFSVANNADCKLWRKAHHTSIPARKIVVERKVFHRHIVSIGGNGW
jgi:hypothetical protein